MEENNKNIDDIIDGLGNQEEPEKEVENDEPEQNPDDNQEDLENQQNPDEDPEDNDPDDQGDAEEESEDKKSGNSVIRNLRKNVRETNKQVKQYEAVLEKIAKQQGISKDDLVENLQREADEKEAKEKNISPEIQRQLREQQEALENLKQERQREVFNNKFNELSQKYPMNNDETREFIQDAIDKGIDLGNPNTDFEAVYIALNYDSIIENVKKETEQEVLKRIEKQRKDSPGKVSSRNQGDGIKKSNIDDVLKDLGI